MRRKRPIAADVRSEDGDLQGARRPLPPESEEERLRRLLAEIDHRAKNMLAVIQAIARLMAKGEGARSFATRFNARIASLAATHDLLATSAWQGVAMGDLVRAQLRRYQSLIGTRVTLDGPPVRISADAAQSLGMALFELAANAHEHGALSRSEGAVRIRWRLKPSRRVPRFELSWREEGGPPVGPVGAKGFGSMILEDMMKSTFDAEVALDYPSSGLTWRLAAAADRLLAG